MEALSKEFAAALLKATSSINGAVKDSTNPHFKSRYADLESVIDAVKKPLLDNGITFLQRTHPQADCVSVETILVHESGQTLSCGVLSLPADRSNAQGFGSAITYARRYSLSTALGVPQVDDDGNGASVQTAKPAAPESHDANVTKPLSAGDYKIVTKCSFKGRSLSELKADDAQWKLVTKIMADEGHRKNLDKADVAALTAFMKEN